MTDLYKWRIYCETDARFEYVWDTVAPSTCPVNASHTVNLNSIADLARVDKYRTIGFADSPYLISGYNIYRCDTTGGNITVNLKSATGVNVDRVIIFQKLSAVNTLTIAAFAGETIDGNLTYTITGAKHMVKLHSDGTNWEVLALGSVTGELASDLEGALYNDPYQTNELVIYDNLDFRKLKLNLTALVNPTVSNDNTEGYGIGSRWVNVVDDVEFVCVDASTGAAVWKSTSTQIANVGTGAGVYKNLTGGTFNFKSIKDAGSNRILVTGVTNEITLDVVEASININNLNSVLSIAKGGTNNTTYNTGGIIFYDGTKLTDDAANLHWDNINKYFGVGTNNPTYNFQVDGSVRIDTGPIEFYSNLNMEGNKITNVTTPTDPTDAVNKQYVDNIINNLLDAKGSVRVATTSPHVLGADFEDGDIIDGITLATGNRILIKNQTNPIENGIYVINASGAPTRAVDLASGNNCAAAFTFVEEGTVNADSGWLCNTDRPNDVIDTDGNTWVLFTGISNTAAGDALTKVGNVLNVNVDGTSIEIVADALHVINAPLVKGDILTTSGTTQSSLPVGSNNQVLIADSSQPLGLRWGTPSLPANLNAWVFVDQKTTATNGGSAVSGSWIQRVLNTTEVSTGVDALLLSGGDANRFSLVAGRYIVYVVSAFYRTRGTRIRLYNTTDSAITSESVNIWAVSHNNAILHTYFEITGTKKYEIQYRCTLDQSYNGLGTSIGLDSSPERYTIVHITKL